MDDFNALIIGTGVTESTIAAYVVSFSKDGLTNSVHWLEMAKKYFT